VPSPLHVYASSLDVQASGDSTRAADFELVVGRRGACGCGRSAKGEGVLVKSLLW